MAASPNLPNKQEMKVLCVGLPRSGSLSMRDALTIMGLKVHHTIPTIGTARHEVEWSLLGKAADKLFDVLPSYKGGEVTREEWDEIWGPYEGVTDIAGCFASQLVDAYPEAKVVLTIRDFDKWRVSSEYLIDIMFQPLALMAVQAEKITGSSITRASLKMMHGVFHGTETADMKAKLRKTYDDHHKMIREKVGPERLLVYELGSGWGPLCEFLGRPVPEEEFPWRNENRALKEKMFEMFREQFLGGVTRAVPWVVGAVAAGFGWWAMAKRYPVSWSALPFVSFGK